MGLAADREVGTEDGASARLTDGDLHPGQRPPAGCRGGLAGLLTTLCGVRRFLTVTLVVLAACAAEAERPGSPAVYDRIEAMTDCRELQGEFDTAMESVESRRPGDDLRDVSLAYAEAADQRMKSLDCYG